MKTVSYAVTYEYPMNQPVTFRGQDKANSFHTIAGRALKAAKKQPGFRGTQPTSIVVVLQVEKEA